MMRRSRIVNAVVDTRRQQPRRARLLDMEMALCTYYYAGARLN
jgi:hypothetical protein